MFEKEFLRFFHSPTSRNAQDGKIVCTRVKYSCLSTFPFFYAYAFSLFMCQSFILKHATQRTILKGKKRI